jgi:hypothetical protein
MRESPVQNDFLTPSQWLSQFLSSRNLESVTGGPLFTYQMRYGAVNHLHKYDMVNKITISYFNVLKLTFYKWFFI